MAISCSSCDLSATVGQQPRSAGVFTWTSPYPKWSGCGSLYNKTSSRLSLITFPLGLPRVSRIRMKLFVFLTLLIIAALTVADLDTAETLHKAHKAKAAVYHAPKAPKAVYHAPKAPKAVYHAPKAPKALKPVYHAPKAQKAVKAKPVYHAPPKPVYHAPVPAAAYGAPKAKGIKAHKG